VLYDIETGRFEDRTGLEVETKLTLGAVIPDYMEKYVKVHNRDWKRKQALLAKFTTLHDKQIVQIKRADVVKACDLIRKSAPTSANRALAQYISDHREGRTSRPLPWSTPASDPTNA